MQDRKKLLCSNKSFSLIMDIDGYESLGIVRMRADCR